MMAERKGRNARKPSTLNRDIVVSLLFSLLAACFLIAILLRGFLVATAELSGPLFRYGLPFGLLSLFFYWTATKQGIDHRNRLAIRTSFYIAFLTTLFAAVFLVLSLFLIEA